jgi:hypothetical protein
MTLLPPAGCIAGGSRPENSGALGPGGANRTDLNRTNFSCANLLALPLLLRESVQFARKTKSVGYVSARDAKLQGWRSRATLTSKACAQRASRAPKRLKPL